MTAQPLPGDPDARMLAAADQRHAAVSAAVDQLVQRARHAEPGTAGWIRLTYHDVIDAVGTLDTGKDGAFEAAALGIAAEAILRLAREVTAR